MILNYVPVLTICVVRIIPIKSGLMNSVVIQQNMRSYSLCINPCACVFLLMYGLDIYIPFGKWLLEFLEILGVCDDLLFVFLPVPAIPYFFPLRDVVEWYQIFPFSHCYFLTISQYSFMFWKRVGVWLLPLID